MPKGLRQTKPGAAYRWIKPSRESWKLVQEITARLEQEGVYPFKLTENRVATMAFEEVLRNLPPNWKPQV